MASEITFEYKPIPVHMPFHQSGAYERALFGAFGSGKTYAICAEAIAFGLEQPGSRILVTRRTVPELRDTTETVFFDILPPELFAAGEARRAGGHYESFTLPNGSTFLFRSIDDWNKHKSLNVAAIAWDEADEFDEETYMGMSSRVRQRDPTSAGKKYGATEITRRGMWCASNPAGHNWLYERFVDPKTKKSNTAAFRSTSFDNPYLAPGYINSLLEYPEPWLRRYVLCQFDDFAGQIYEDWAWDTHVIQPHQLPPDMFSRDQVFWMGMDPGTRAPTAGLWVWMDPDKRRLVGVAEYQQDGIAASEHATAWRKIEAKLRGRVAWRVADPTIMTRDRGSNMALHTQYARMGFNFQLGPKQHKDRIPMLGQMIHAGRFVVTSDCPQTYESIKNYKWEDISPTQRAKGIDPPERPLKKNDHLVDCAQYLASRWVKPMKDVIPKAPETLDDELRAAIRKQVRGRRLRPQNHDLGTLRV